MSDLTERLRRVALARGPQRDGDAATIKEAAAALDAQPVGLRDAAIRWRNAKDAFTLAPWRKNLQRDLHDAEEALRAALASGSGEAGE